MLLSMIILLLLVTFGLAGCYRETGSTHDVHMGGHQCDNMEVRTNRSYDSAIDINWPY
jgi:predicted small secreted protein